MLSDKKLEELKKVVTSFSRDELLWASGYLAGSTNSLKSATDAAPATVAPKKVTLVFGSETGNAKKLATQFSATLKKQGIMVKLAGLDQYRLADLLKEEYFLIVTSTQGEGDVPAMAKNFYDHIFNNTLQFKNLKYGVLGLGDSSYPQFCKTAQDFDERLNELGGQQLLPLQKCDTDYEEEANEWVQKVIAILQQANTASPANMDTSGKKPTGKKYYTGKVITNINLNDRGSAKETYHIEIATDEIIEYQPGDALGIIPFNKHHMIEKIIGITGVDPKLVITTTKITATVEDLLKQHLNICYLLKDTVKKYAAISANEIPDVRMSLLELLQRYPLKNDAQFEEIIKVLTPQAPRLYSISSSPNAHGTNEVHITVSKNRFSIHDEEHYGVCSEFLSDLKEDHEVEFFIQKTKHFKLPGDDKDIIMIGPGTGIAPFRSFIAERDATGANGKNWLFFGDQHFVTDFLYQAEIQNFLQTGCLQNLDVAFSRDGKEKVYVQHRMQQKSKELHNWIKSGASIYVCGTKHPMSTDVENVLLKILQDEGSHSEADAKNYLTQMADEGRYAKDVY